MAHQFLRRQAVQTKLLAANNFVLKKNQFPVVKRSFLPSLHGIFGALCYLVEKKRTFRNLVN